MACDTVEVEKNRRMRNIKVVIVIVIVDNLSQICDTELVGYFKFYSRTRFGLI